LQESTRWLVWLLGAMVLIVVMLRAARVARLHADGQATRAALRPAEVGQLDIRPESLPANIGASARQLCQQGQAHAAMTLLYRGAISRLVHQHSVPIAAASTEGDCLRLARPLLAPEALGYFKRLVALWLRVAYGHVQALEDEVLALCDGFAAHLDGGLNPGGLQP
jgi:hypothetical protein